ncbi:hypothetical protein JD79_04106 [Geodermatophilus normandii]|uniref:Uncharacterized protein n=1 Tax=Geodermatophilus normandii TaxID=1137989 RepID=A0A317QPL3_9ACTN|nr:hypothetical protein [Geodermatophilus normandii]PWW24914.1 hypothetical protein JD79_04106 [Geodermatophilus normandii]
MSTWRDSDDAKQALAEQGYYDEDHEALNNTALAGTLAKIFMRKPVRASDAESFDRFTAVKHQGLSKNQLVDEVLPHFREGIELTDEEFELWKKNRKEHPDLDERQQTLASVGNLLWGTMCRTSSSGAVQKLLVPKGLLLVEAKLGREGEPGPLKVATDDHELIMEFFVRPRGDQLVRVSGSVRADCLMVGMAFDGISARMRQELGMSVTSAVTDLMQVASPNFAVITGSSTEDSKALTSGASKR